MYKQYKRHFIYTEQCACECVSVCVCEQTYEQAIVVFCVGTTDQ